MSDLSMLDDRQKETNDDKLDNVLITVRELDTDTAATKQVSFTAIGRNEILHEISHSSSMSAPFGHLRKKLLILDINGVLADIVSPPPKGCQADKRISGRAVFKRPFCTDFLEFCFERFDVGIWSSRKMKILERVAEFLLGDMKNRLLFCWDLSYCTASEFKSLENKHKALVFKDLKRIWEKHDALLPWEIGYYNEYNTVLLDDSPYKALLNPPNTALFPHSYKFVDASDTSFSTGGELRIYLEGLALADNVQKYIEKHPFGQGAITEKNPSWNFYQNVISSMFVYSHST